MPLIFVKNDITKMDVDAIVNAANNTLLGGGGVDGAIHRAAGPRLLEECRTLNGCETGQAKLTRGYDLPCQYVIHTVGPVWEDGDHGEPELLAACYRNALALAKEYRCETVAFPLISSGAYGYPRAQALRVAVDEISCFLAESDMTVYIVALAMDMVQPTGALYREVVAALDESHADARQVRGAVAGPEASMGPGELFRRHHREDNARNETVFEHHAAQAAKPRPEAAPIPSNEGFRQMLLRLEAEKGLTDASLCKRANVDRRFLRRIKNDPDYRPSKPAALAFAVGLGLSPDEARALLGCAGYALDGDSRADVAVECCLRSGDCAAIDINLILFKLGLQTLGE